MADNPGKYGFRWVGSLHGYRAPTPIPRVVATGYQAAPGGTNVDLGVGDPVIVVTGTAVPGSVAIATVGGAIDGVIVGVDFYWDGNKFVKNKVLPGGTAWGTIQGRRSIVWVVPAAGQIFEVVGNNNSSFTTEATYRGTVHKNADVIFVADATLKRAFPKLDCTTVNTNNTLGFRILDIAPDPSIDFTGLNVPFRVTPNVVREAPYQTTGV